MVDFGYTKKGISEFTHSGGIIHGSRFICEKSGIAKSISIWLKQSGTDTPKVKCAIYKRSDGSRVGYTEPWRLTPGWNGKKTFAIVSGGKLEANTEYWLVYWHENGMQIIIRYINIGVSDKWAYQHVPYNGFPNTFSPEGYSDGQMSIYCTYTPTEKGTLNVYAVADSEEVTASFMVNRQGPYDTPYTLKLTPATYTLIGNYKGQTDKKTVTLMLGTNPDITFHFPVMHKFTIVSDPSPINFTFNTEAQSTPFVRELIGGTYTIVMPKSWMIGLDEYVFEQWENGNRKPTRTITLASPQEITLTATYRLRQIDEAGPINQRQAKDTLQEVVGQGADISPNNPLPTEDSGVHSNPEKWLHDNHWEADQVEITAVGVGGQQALGNPVVAGKKRRVRVLHVRHAGTNNTVLSLLEGTNVKRSWDIAAQSTRVISSEDGWEFNAGETPLVQSSDVTGGNTFVGAEGVEE